MFCLYKYFTNAIKYTLTRVVKQIKYNHSADILGPSSEKANYGIFVKKYAPII